MVTVDPEEIVPYFTGIILTIRFVMELENLVRRGLALKVYSVGNYYVEVPLKWSLGKCCHVIQLFGVSTMDYCHYELHENGGTFGHRGI